MPGFDRTGPMGFGPMTGRRRGLCNPAHAGYGRGFAGTFGFGRGMGRGFGRGFWNQPPYFQAYEQSPEDELNMLKAEANSLKKSLEMINRKVAELEKSSE
jgi:hypothetical protein